MSLCGSHERTQMNDESRAFNDGFLLANLMNIYSSKGKGSSEDEVFVAIKGGIELVERRLGLKDRNGKRIFPIDLEREVMKLEENKPYSQAINFLRNSKTSYFNGHDLPEIPEAVGETFRKMFDENLGQVARKTYDEN